MKPKLDARVGWGLAAGVAALVFLFAFKAVVYDKALCNSGLEDADPSETLRQAAFRLRAECAKEPRTRASFQRKGDAVWIVEHTGYTSLEHAFDANSGRLTYEYVCGDVIGPLCGGCGGYGSLPDAGKPDALVPACANIDSFDGIAAASAGGVYPPPADVGDVHRGRVPAQALTMSTSLVAELAKVQPGNWIGPDPELVCCAIDGRELVWIHWASLGANTYWGGAYDRVKGTLDFSYVDAQQWDPVRMRYEGPLKRSIGVVPEAREADGCGSYRMYRRIPLPACPPTADLIQSVSDG